MGTPSKAMDTTSHTQRKRTHAEMVAVASGIASPPSNSHVVPRYNVLVPEKLSKEGLAILEQHHHVTVDLTLDQASLLREIPKYDALIVRSGIKVTREILFAGTKLKVVGRAGVGVDNIDLPAASERGIMVVNAPTGNCIAAAEHAVALMCSLARHIPNADASMKKGEWARSKYVGVSLVNKTLAVIGFGRIGREVAKRAQGLGMKIVAYDPFVTKEAGQAVGVDILPLDEALQVADFVTLHLPLLDSTKNLINKERLHAMKTGVRIINAARGGVIDEQALLDAINDNKVAGAALDCFADEPPNKHPESVSMKLSVHPKIIGTPHLGASTEEAQYDVAIEISESVVSVLAGGLVSTLVNAPAMAEEKLKKILPRAKLAEYLGDLAIAMAQNEGRPVNSCKIEYHLRDEKEDTRMIKAYAIKGMLQGSSEVPINLVNAETIAKSRGLTINETKVPINPDEDQFISITIGNGPEVKGRTLGGHPHVTHIGPFETDLRLQGVLFCYTQVDRPGQLGKAGSILGKADVNIANMTIGRHRLGAAESEAMVLLGLDSVPDAQTVKQISEQVSDGRKPILVKFE
mmetsp:Transcript_15136/g.26379  ORF Transcript_15136/g.26379 Transcript_15136/m.26379 type:complete len:577 (-) Transcript_15136:1051-2781(-)|eukprot:CAMPEP_0184706298 /NCGR_PEP_ID=MMETSP0313-20130426/36688_1 /TAXON_ID=2792 /ORGANISM="Porphyridium aerugineum, Strain SAG 1380-2" /LENGTH=576 /DNA_ID=CAMNT_0027167849 /DNA_START=577 /DNA_END=2307 /DNA_ORIENTATION=+